MDNDFNSAEINVKDPTKDNFTQLLSIKEILDGLEISKNDYCRALPISKDEDLELYLKRQPNSCFVNKYCDDVFKAWQADIQFVFNECKTVICINVIQINDISIYINDINIYI